MLERGKGKWALDSESLADGFIPKLTSCASRMHGLGSMFAILQRGYGWWVRKRQGGALTSVSTEAVLTHRWLHSMFFKRRRLCSVALGSIPIHNLSQRGASRDHHHNAAQPCGSHSAHSCESLWLLRAASYPDRPGKRCCDRRGGEGYGRGC